MKAFFVALTVLVLTVCAATVNDVYLSEVCSDVIRITDTGKKESAEYKYPHAYGEWVEQQYLPNKLKGKKYYRPTTHGYESEILKARKEKGKNND